MGQGFISEKEVANVVKALRAWIEESGILKVIEKCGIRDYLFLIAGSVAYGHAIKNKSDVDLVLLYERYEKRHSSEDYERMHEELRKFSSEVAENQKARDIEWTDRNIREKLNQTVSPLLYGEEIIKNSSSIAELCAKKLGMRVISASFLIPDRTVEAPQAQINLENKLSMMGLRFYHFYMKPLPHLKDFIGGRSESILPYVLFTIKRGIVIAANDKNTQNKFTRVIISLIKIYFGCEIAKNYFKKKEAEIYIEKARRSKDLAMRDYAKVLDEDVKNFKLIS